ncbi:MAG TPA: hypothetical protein VMF58_15985 [Rhizomicrobium sp.]|nr:hypothetical protein [Rhizomicrobium sp.]
MFPASAPQRDLRLTPREWLFLAATIAFWAGFVVFLGKDTSWDFRNYHWYIPYAFLNHRMGMDIAVAHLASYYNPFLDIPFYLLATHTSSWLSLAVLGAVQGANVVPLYVIGRQSLLVDDHKLYAGLLALLGQTGGLGINLYGTHYYDNVMSLFIFTSLAIIVVHFETLRSGALWKTATLSAIATLVTGLTVGLKLPEAPFALGIAAALIVIGGDWKHLGTRVIAGAIFGAAGMALFAAPWMLQMEHLTGNPLFPYFNEHYHSALAVGRNYRDLRFVPTHFWREILFPIYFSYDWSIADDIPFKDIRVATAYVAVIVAAIFWLFGKRSKEPLMQPEIVRVLFAFATVSYIAWLKVFGIYRYILALEMLAPLLIAASVGLLPLPRRTQMIALGCLFFAALVFTRPDYLERAPLGDPYVDVAVPKIADPRHTMILMTGDDPLGFIAPSLPPEIPILRIDGWMITPKDGSGLTKIMRKRVAAWKGDRYLIADANNMLRAHDALKDYGLAIVWTKCSLFDTNLIGAYQLCPLVPWQG